MFFLGFRYFACPCVGHGSTTAEVLCGKREHTVLIARTLPPERHHSVLWLVPQITLQIQALRLGGPGPVQAAEFDLTVLPL
jgi:hypothetical protein